MSDRTAHEEPAALAVHVLATTQEGTRSALEAAARLTGGTGTRVILLVPRPQPCPLDQPERADLERYRALVTRIGVRATLIDCVCHRLDDVVRQMLGRSSLVIVGGASRRWWPSREQRLANRLMAEGYPVLFSRVPPARPGRPRAAGMWAPVVLAVLSGSTPARAQTLAPAAAREGASKAAAGAAASSNPLAGLQFGATLETFYEYDWNRPPDRVLRLRAYDTRANTFAIQQAAAIVELSPDVPHGRRFGARLDLQFGMATETVQGNPANEPRPDAYRNLWQAYGTYVFPVGRQGLQVDFGKYASMLGYETNYAKDDQAFSRALLFDFLPFYHMGVRVTFPVNDRVSLLYMLSNGIQQTEDFNNFKSSQFAAVLKPLRAVAWVVNYYVGQEQPDNGLPAGPDGFFKVWDTYATVTPGPKLSLAVDVNETTNQTARGGPRTSLTGLAGYGRYQWTPSTAFGLRYERLDDEGLFAPGAQVLQEVTATAERRLAGGFLVRAEFRRDWSNRAFFPGPAGTGDLRPYENTALVGCIWWFGNKPGAW